MPESARVLLTVVEPLLKIWILKSARFSGVPLLLKSSSALLLLEPSTYSLKRRPRPLLALPVVPLLPVLPLLLPDEVVPVVLPLLLELDEVLELELDPLLPELELLLLDDDEELELLLLEEELELELLLLEDEELELELLLLDDELDELDELLLVPELDPVDDVPLPELLE